MIPINIRTIITTCQGLASQVGTSASPGLATRAAVQETGGSFVGTKSVLKKEFVNSDAGINASYQFTLICDSSQFTTTNPAPAPKKRVVVAGTVYKVISHETDAIGAIVRLHLGSEYDR